MRRFEEWAARASSPRVVSAAVAAACVPVLGAALWLRYRYGPEAWTLLYALPFSAFAGFVWALFFLHSPAPVAAEEPVKETQIPQIVRENDGLCRGVFVGLMLITSTPGVLDRHRELYPFALMLLVTCVVVQFWVAIRATRHRFSADYGSFSTIGVTPWWGHWLFAFFTAATGILALVSRA